MTLKALSGVLLNIYSEDGHKNYFRKGIKVTVSAIGHVRSQSIVNVSKPILMSTWMAFTQNGSISKPQILNIWIVCTCNITNIINDDLESVNLSHFFIRKMEVTLHHYAVQIIKHFHTCRALRKNAWNLINS